MGKILSEEERRHLLEKLNSKMVATRFMALKSITFSINQNQIDFSKMDMEIPEFTKNLVRIIELLAEKDPEEMVKRESGVCIEILKKKLNPAAMHDLPKCSSCGESALVSSRFCTQCGVDLRGQKWVSDYKLCEKCKTPIDPRWNNCIFCGNQLIKKVNIVKTCQFCKKNVEASWLMCPFCGSKLKITAGL
jgi:hypothetical protein